MHVDSQRPQALSMDDLTGWLQTVVSSADYSSPFFHPEYALALAEFRPQVEVAVIRQKGSPIGWFSFERHNGNVCRPLGIKLADFQGIVVRPGECLTLPDLIPRLGLLAFHYDHLLADQAPRLGRIETAGSPYLNLRGGYNAYVDRQRSNGGSIISQVQRKERKLERHGHRVEFRWHDPDPLALERLWKWKAAKRRSTGTVDILAFDWVRAVLQRIASTNRPGFHGAVSTLRINGELAAVHLGMHTDTAFHYWFPAYSTAWAAYSPGLILLLRVAEECAYRGIERLDLGKGDDPYKQSFTNACTVVATGTVDRNRLRQLFRTSLTTTKHWIKNSPLREAARCPSRWLKQWNLQNTMKAAHGSR